MPITTPSSTRQTPVSALIAMCWSRDGTKLIWFTTTNTRNTTKIHRSTSSGKRESSQLPICPPTNMPQNSSSAASQSTFPQVAYEMTPEIEVGTIASIDVAAALRCVSPSHTSAGTITVPPPMPNMPDSSPTATPTITSTAMPRADSSSPAGSAPNSRSAFPPNFPLGCTLDRTLSSARSTLSAFEILEISDFFISPLPSHFLHLAIIAIVHSHTSQRRKTGRIREGRRETTPVCRTSGARQPRDRLSRCARAATAVPAIRTRIQ